MRIASASSLNGATISDELFWNGMLAMGLALVAMLAFAGNSLLCRLALQQGGMDPASFTLVRLGSGATVTLSEDDAKAIAQYLLSLK